MRSPTIVYSERDNVYGDKDTHVFYSIEPVIDRFIVTELKDGIATIKPMYKSATANMLAIVAGCFEEKSNVGSEVFKIYGEALNAIRLVLNHATVMVNRENVDNLISYYGKNVKNENQKCEQAMLAGNATTCEKLTENVG